MTGAPTQVLAIEDPPLNNFNIPVRDLNIGRYTARNTSTYLLLLLPQGGTQSKFLYLS